MHSQNKTKLAANEVQTKGDETKKEDEEICSTPLGNKTISIKYLSTPMCK
jgi:hypothetical protein